MSLSTADEGGKPFSNSRYYYGAAVDLISGSMGGAASVYVGQPLDTVKVKMQAFPHIYKSSYKCFTHTLKNEGLVRGLYSGTLPSLAAQISENAMLFLAYGQCQKVLSLIRNKNLEQLTVIENATAGSLAAFFSSLTLCPTELIKNRMQTALENFSAGQNEVQKNAMAITREILKNEGISGLYKGFVPTVLREMPGYFCFFGGYEFSRYMLTPSGKSKDDLGAGRTMISGAFGGIVFWITTFPMDVIKSRQQIASTKSNLNLFTVLVNIAKTDGVPALYNGLLPTIFRTIPATASLFLAVEKTKKFLNGF
ncbi:DgyrCDS8058 [Dimorphilus gyrociliatus]|uniref:DgyrCDS8058 n=1 Tax=Dimorphilus gyrociliatus TaxID=2664684 RepID=A0A7I8VT23_9ANNE|nr:DgyrCDS8058 [Dimorphilus gyrociliatus]